MSARVPSIGSIIAWSVWGCLACANTRTKAPVENEARTPLDAAPASSPAGPQRRPDALNERVWLGFFSARGGHAFIGASSDRQPALYVSGMGGNLEIDAPVAVRRGEWEPELTGALLKLARDPELIGAGVSASGVPEHRGLLVNVFARDAQAASEARWVALDALSPEKRGLLERTLSAGAALSLDTAVLALVAAVSVTGSRAEAIRRDERGHFAIVALDEGELRRVPSLAHALADEERLVPIVRQEERDAMRLIHERSNRRKAGPSAFVELPGAHVHQLFLHILHQR